MLNRNDLREYFLECQNKSCKNNTISQNNTNNSPYNLNLNNCYAVSTPHNVKTGTKLKKILKYLKKKTKIKKKLKSLLEENSNILEVNPFANRNNGPVEISQYYFNSSPNVVKNNMCENSPYIYNSSNKENINSNLLKLDIQYSFSPNVLMKKINTCNQDLLITPDKSKAMTKILAQVFDSKVDYYSNSNLFKEDDIGKKNITQDLTQFKELTELRELIEIPNLTENPLLISSITSNIFSKKKNLIFDIKKIDKFTKKEIRDINKLKQKFMYNYIFNRNLSNKKEINKLEETNLSISSKSSRNNAMNSYLLNSKYSLGRFGMKYKMYSKEEKQFCIKLVHYGMDTKKVAKLCEVPHKSLVRWVKVGIERKSGGGRKSKDPCLESKLLFWYNKLIQSGKIPTQKQIREKALKFTSAKDFLASKGWLEKFKKKFNITMQTKIKKKDSNQNTTCEVIDREYNY